MINTEYIELFETNTDAESVNRGFYYQYLVTLRKWLNNYINQTDNLTYCEVDDDIKEVGDELIFTQVKCFNKSFSFQSDEVKKSLFHFYILYLKNRNTSIVKFLFTTNTSLGKREKLIKAWIENPDLDDVNLSEQIQQKIQKTLIALVNQKKNSKLNKKHLKQEKRDEILRAADALKREIASSKTDLFIKSIKWEFLRTNPIVAIENVFAEVRELLTHEKFYSKPISIIENVFLSEVFRCSQLSDKEKRVLSNERMAELLNKTDEELNAYIDTRLITLLDIRFEEIRQNFNSIHKDYYNLNIRVDKLETNINQSANIKYPKALTLIPSPLDERCNEYQVLSDPIKKFLFKKRAVSVHSTGGYGKTFVIQNFIEQNYHKYNHIIWIDSLPSLNDSITLNSVLLDNLGIKKQGGIDIVVNKLQQIDGDNLMVIDNYENDLLTLQKLKSLKNWKLIITTREIISHISNYKLPKLNIDSSKRIFSTYCNEKVDETVFSEFIHFIDFNPLVIKICAKTISNGLELNLESLLDSFKQQKLDAKNLEIGVEMEGSNTSVSLLSFLQEKFEFGSLNDNEKSYLSFLALLPTEDVDIKDLTMICGKEDYENNLNHFTNLTNLLHKKGWVERVDEKIRMHRLVQELILYKERGHPYGYTPNFMMIIWLYHRIDETAQNDPSRSFKYLKYAESILNKIKEEHRTSVYQPLLMLENALLNAYGWINDSKVLHDRWIGLVKRAENYLPSKDRNLGIMYNNLSLSYSKNENSEFAIRYLEKSINILSLEQDSIDLLINALNNITQVYLFQNNLKSIKKSLDKTQKIINNKPSIVSQHKAIHNYMYAKYCLKLSDFKGAVNHYNFAIKYHLEVDKSERNDLSLVVYYSSLIYLRLRLDQEKEVKKTIEQIENVLNEYKGHYNNTLEGVQVMIKNIDRFYKHYN